MSWLDKLLPPKIKRNPSPEAPSVMPEGVWTKCTACDAVLYHADLEANLYVCPKCDHHHGLSARDRLSMLLDDDGQHEIGHEVLPKDILQFTDTKKYSDRLKTLKQSLNETDALVVKQGTIHDIPAVVAAFEFKFIGGSMGSVVGERFVRGVRAAVELNAPFICVSMSGGARMQEGLNSLMQMAKTSAALHLLKEKRLPFISILVDPTMGGVSASFAFLGDIVIAEPNALIGFAGPRVIKETVRQTLPEGFQRAEFLQEKGAVDLIVDRRELKSKVAKLLAILTHRADDTAI